MNVKRVIGILIAVGLDIITLILGITGTFISMVSGNFLFAGIIFLIMLVLLVVFPLIGVLVTKNKPVAINDNSMNSSEDRNLSLREIKRIASHYQYGFYLGKTAKGIINQANLVAAKIEEAKAAVNNRFEINSITWDRYMGVVESAADTAINNLDMMARRISVLDEKEYASLASPLKVISRRNNDSGRLEFYQDNKNYIEQGLYENEEMFNKLDRLSIELRKSAEDNAMTDAVIQDIEDITNQVKYYNHN